MKLLLPFAVKKLTVAEQLQYEIRDFRAVSLMWVFGAVNMLRVALLLRHDPFFWNMLMGMCCFNLAQAIIQTYRIDHCEADLKTLLQNLQLLNKIATQI